MSVSMFRAYAEQLEPLRAEQTLDAAQASAYPHLEADARKSWMQRLIDTIKQVAEDTAHEFSFNGVKMGARKLRQHFTEAFGDRAA